jgi:hypothetical protein
MDYKASSEDESDDDGADEEEVTGSLQSSADNVEVGSQ